MHTIIVRVAVDAAAGFTEKVNNFMLFRTKWLLFYTKDGTRDTPTHMCARRWLIHAFMGKRGVIPHKKGCNTE